MSRKLDSPLDRRLLRLIQKRVPLVREPYAQLAAELACQQATLLDRLRALGGPHGLIREVSGIFDSTALGYEQALVAFRLAESELSAAGKLVAAHPGVSHCYGRTGRYNLWFTLAVSPASRMGLRGMVQTLARQVRAEGVLILPALKRYKLDVAGATAALLDPMPGDERSESAGTAAPTPVDEPSESAGTAPPALSPERVRAVRALQMDLPRQADPFAPLAASHQLDPDMLLVHAADFLAAGWMRRYAAVLRHRAAGAGANVMAAWRVEDARIDAAGAVCGGFATVSHCYWRPAGADWPYTLYTMIHGRSPEHCRMTLQQIAAAAGIADFAALWTTAEFKKNRVPLFSPDEAAWEAGAG